MHDYGHFDHTFEEAYFILSGELVRVSEAFSRSL